MKGSQAYDDFADWTPKRSSGLRSRDNELHLPTTLRRTPSALVKECENAFDAGLPIAALTLVLTIPDVCASLADGVAYREWCVKYLGLANGEKCEEERKPVKEEKEIEEGFKKIRGKGIFTASDLYQLRCAVLHAGNSVIDGKGEKYSPYRSIGVCIQNDPFNLVCSFGHNGIKVGESEEGCGYDCTIRLEALILLMAKGVRKFLEEDPKRDRETSCDVEEPSKAWRTHIGVVDFRPLLWQKEDES